MNAAAEDPATTLAPNDQNLIWIDLEMTGLSPERDRIIELAVVVTDPQVTRRVEGPVLAIHQSDATLDAMDAWNKSTHGKSGLVDRVRASTIDEAAARRHRDRVAAPLCRRRQEPDVRQHDLPGPALSRQSHAAAGIVLSLSQPRRQHAEGAGPPLAAGRCSTT